MNEVLSEGEAGGTYLIGGTTQQFGFNVQHFISLGHAFLESILDPPLGPFTYHTISQVLMLNCEETTFFFL